MSNFRLLHGRSTDAADAHAAVAAVLGAAEVQDRAAGRELLKTKQGPPYDFSAYEKVLWWREFNAGVSPEDARAYVISLRRARS